MKGLLPRQVHPILQLLMLVGLAVAGLSLASLLALILANQVYGVSLTQFGELSAKPQAAPHAWAVLMLLQGLSLAGLGAGAAVLPLVLQQSPSDYFAPRRLAAAWGPLGAAVLIVCLIPLLSTIVTWNAGVHFPAFLHDFELWARGMEDQATDITKYLTNFSTPGRLGVGLLVIALVPAIAEELVFRGVVQRNLVRWFASRHVGVWLAAAVFSAVHMQFFGFVPRFLLGLVLGYLYEWSGNILVPMAAHFTQNAFQLVLIYLAQSHRLPTSFDPDANQVLPWPTVLVSAVLSAALLYGLRQRWATPPAAPATPVS
ncbi:CPBP family intramembrane metalloprotease [Hymenobacter sp. HMF4947]|uniref:CPBP family intramembrane metalloprotease n=1 Tax=Hymenobacter ginkgonis TaxID=2682976 RepID=A0A7K1TDE8_9BACT|nr:CPBP family intramembrane glutamic endopeptidase [Hymenobacter ginkgonis]MVN76417.1 CPBP family intramembrane metalloprotease [Hymenobacter ginkgonis]